MAERMAFEVAKPNRAARVEWIGGLVAEAVRVAFLICLGVACRPLWFVWALLLYCVGLRVFRAWATMPVAYELDDEDVTIRRRSADPIGIPLAAVTGVRVLHVGDGVECAERQKAKRAPDLFAYTGVFRGPGLGEFMASVRNSDWVVFLDTVAERGWMLSPADLFGFARTVKARMKAVE